MNDHHAVSEERAFAPRFVPSTAVRRFFDNDSFEAGDTISIAARPPIHFLSLAPIAILGIAGIAIGSLVAFLV